MALIGLNRPDKLNAIDVRVLDGLQAAMDWAEAEPKVRAVVVRGAGKRLLRGRRPGVADRDRAATRRGSTGSSTAGTRAATDRAVSPLPSIAAVHGFAFAGGLELTQVCDFVVVGDADASSVTSTPTTGCSRPAGPPSGCRGSWGCATPSGC